MGQRLKVYICGLQYYRTGLHYVYGSEDSTMTRQLIGVLEDSGMSEYVMDKVSWDM